MPTEYSTSTKGRELRRSLFRRLIQKRRRARPPWRLGCDSMAAQIKTRPFESRIMVNTKLLKLETAKKVLTESTWKKLKRD
jgi:hypothetical protein